MIRSPDRLLEWLLDCGTPAVLAAVSFRGWPALEVLRGPGLFGPIRPVADGADDTTRLMAWLGRDTVR